MEKKIVRTRFAPSPTGELHIGGARTALFNYLLAKQNSGQFVLRIEDTDIARNQEEFINRQHQDLMWLGIKPDESVFQKGEYGPYRQTERLSIYQKYIEKLLVEKKAYHCFCSKNELEKEREEYIAKNQKSNYQYSRKCLKLEAEKVKFLLQNQTEHVIRYRVPQEKNYQLKDLVRGQIVFQGRDIEDFVICRGSGMPLLNFAVVIDDYCMKISHVLRGEEHLPNTAKQLVLYEAFGWKSPHFAHLSIILNREKKKLSKRDQETSQWQLISQLRAKGYLPQAVVNYLLFLGFHPGTTQEIFSLSEAIKEFRLERLHSRGAVYSLEKLSWYNNHYIQKLEENKFAECAWQFLNKEHKLPVGKKEWVTQIALLFRTQLNYFEELINLTDYFFWRPNQQQLTKDKGQDLWLGELTRKLEKTKEWEISKIKALLKDFFANAGETKKEVFLLLRNALTGKDKGPELPKIIFLLGRETTVKRLKINP
jgi:nondiscriminating glutamyl-tRNA synthetase